MNSRFRGVGERHRALMHKESEFLGGGFSKKGGRSGERLEGLFHSTI